MAEPEDEDDFPNDFDGLDFDNIPGLEGPTTNSHTFVVSVPSAVPRDNALSNAASPASSIGSNSIEDMNSSFLAAVDALEARALREIPRDSELFPHEKHVTLQMVKFRTSPKVVCLFHDCKAHLRTHYTAICFPRCSHFWVRGASRLNQTYHEHSPFPESLSVNRKGKRKAETLEDVDVRAILSGYETELTCPICCDLFVATQISNPCGHACCGECGYGWLAQNKYNPSCAVCRSKLSSRKPLLPNFTVDNLVQQHLWSLARSGLPEWQEKGYRMIEWKKRLESWKEQLAVRAAKERSRETARLRRRQSRYYQATYSPVWSPDESMEDAEDEAVARVMPRRGTRSRR